MPVALTDVALVARLIVFSILVVAVVAKLADSAPLSRFLGHLGVSRRGALVARWALLTLEVVVAGLLLVGPSFLAGASVSALMAGFIIALVLGRRRSNAPPCGCLGRLSANTSPGWLGIALRVIGVGSGILIAAGGDPGTWPSLRMLGLAGATAGVALVISRPWSPRHPVEAAAATAGTGTHNNDAWSSRDFSRRKLLTAGGAGLGAVALVPLARVFACTETQGGGCILTGSTTSPDTSSGTPLAVDRTPCFRACSEQRAIREAMASDGLDDCTLPAGNDQAQLQSCAEAFRKSLRQYETDYQLCVARC